MGPAPAVPRARRVPRSRTARAVRGVGIVLAATLAMWVMAAVALWIFAGPDRSAQTHALNIPEGTAAAVRLGGNPLELPADWSLRAGDTLVVENHDVTTHVIRPLQVRIGERQTLLLRSGLGPPVCSVHPSHVRRLDV